MLGDVEADRFEGSLEFICFKFHATTNSWHAHRKVRLDKLCLPLGRRIRAWHDSPSMVAAYNADTWHITAQLLRELRTWELKMLRRMLKLQRRPDEGYVQYNMRTAATIEKWFRTAHVPTLPMRVLKTVFKAAWRDDAFKLDCGDAPLRDARDYRSALWWQTHCYFAPPCRRKQMRTSHQRAGMPKTKWEQLFVEVWGIHWRSRRQACTTLEDWMHEFPDFASAVCRMWSLPPLECDEQALGAEPPWKKVKLPTAIDDLPPSIHNPRATTWDSPSGRLWVQTGNQQVEQVFAGCSRLSSEFLRLLCVRVARTLYGLLERRIRPRLDTAAFAVGRESLQPLGRPLCQHGLGHWVGLEPSRQGSSCRSQERASQPTHVLRRR